MTIAQDENERLRNIFSSKWLPVKEIKELEVQHNLSCRKGKWEQDELIALQDLLDNWLIERNLNRNDLWSVIFGDKQQSRKRHTDNRFKDLFPSLAQSLPIPGRPVMMVYQAVRRLLCKKNRDNFSSHQKWSYIEDLNLKDAFNTIHQLSSIVQYSSCKHDWEAVSREFNAINNNSTGIYRSGQSCRDRWRELCPNGEFIHVQQKIIIPSKEDTNSNILFKDIIDHNNGHNNDPFELVLLNTMINIISRMNWTTETDLDWSLIIRHLPSAVYSTQRVKTKWISLKKIIPIHATNSPYKISNIGEYCQLLKNRLFVADNDM